MKLKTYKVQYRNFEYTFVFRYVSSNADGYKAHIEQMPPYGNRDTSLSATHRLPDEGGYKICWSGHVVSETDMDAIVAVWSQATVMYIVNGGTGIDKYVSAIQNGEPEDNGHKFYSVDYAGSSYEFEFEYTHDSTNGYRAYIIRSPEYRDRSTALTKTHRIKEGNQYYVCWSEKIWSEESLDAVVALWCKATVMYIVLGGEALDEHAAKLISLMH